MNLPLLATEGFGLNLNLFETNVLNWAVVVFGLYKFLPGFLGKMLQKRREGILLELKDAEDRLLKATQALEKANVNLKNSKEEYGIPDKFHLKCRKIWVIGEKRPNLWMFYKRLLQH